MKFLEFVCLCESLHLPGFFALLFANNCSIHLCLLIIGNLWNLSEKSQQQAIHCLWVSEFYEIWMLPQLSFLMWNSLTYDWVCKYFAELDTVCSEKRFWEKSWNECYNQHEARWPFWEGKETFSFTMDKDYALDTFFNHGLPDALE